ncbi:TPA: hypothetical protein ACGW6Y_005553 [Bacillus cereus]|uniref:Uncharacterized protein n=1 Tax=Bacillus cereus (strain B4264) TaxID=405532 RepID=B7H8U0_BACC4|nr:hypothetical protein [Bacillus cereus]ACK61076.1 hypothetical protein BCB4264_A3554 [Bacillus cereus B4264]UYY92158.1 hypothetical protein OIU11_17035 [Bacillus cereus]
MNQQGNTTNLDVNLLIKEYEATITTLISENVKYKTLLKQKAIEEQQLQEEMMRHVAPPAPPAVPTKEIVETEVVA